MKGRGRRPRGEAAPKGVIAKGVIAKGVIAPDGQAGDAEALRAALKAIGVPVRAVTGDEYLRQLVVRVSEVLGMRYAFVAEMIEGDARRLRTVAMADTGRLIENFEYDVAGTPCADVIANETYAFASGVRRKYPDDQLIVELGGDAYVGTPLVDRNNRVLGLIAVVHGDPITNLGLVRTVLELFAVRAGAELERRSTEAAMYRLQRQLLAAERIGQFGTFEWDIRANTVEWSPGMYDLYGVDPATAPPLTFQFAMSFVDPADARTIEAQVTEALAGRGRVDVAYHITRPDGSRRELVGHGEVERAADGPPVRLIGTVHDWGERAEAERALRASEERYRSLVESAAFGIYRSTVDGRFIAVNAALARMLGYESEAELLRADVAQDIYFDPVDRARLVEAARTYGPVEPVEVPWRRRDGTAITVRLSGSRTAGGDGADHFTMVAEDVTTRRRLEDQLRQTQKMEGIGRLAGGVAHDFNNILTAITSYADLLLVDLAGDERAKADLLEIRRAADRAASLTRQLLAFSRQQVLSARVLELNGIVSGMDRMLRRIIGEDLMLATDLRAEGRVRADPAQLEQVLLNLVVNARDAMEGGGRLTISTADRLVRGDTAGPVAIAPGPYVVLTVADTGVGMDAATLGRIFEPFFTTKPIGQGTGLGLATVYGIVKQSGGYVLATSSPGAGAVFEVLLPGVAGTAEWPVPAAAQPARTGRETILLVEDDGAVRQVSAIALRRAGYQVLEAESPKAAIALAAEAGTSIDLLLTDVVMPGMSGRTLSDTLRGTWSELKVLYMSGYPGNPGTRDALLEPGAPFLPKPFTAEALVEAVRLVLDGVPLTLERR